ncbi:MAG TPA: serine/threonine-protein kinase [Polyangiaceae bacterium]|jgi:hypothetical protein|nr:serine/threonine-protein kinase [Polyangiaceae bacterium]
MSRIDELAAQFGALARRVPSHSDDPHAWQEEVIEAVAECLDRADDFTPQLQSRVPVVAVAPLKAALRRLRVRVQRYSPANNSEIETALQLVAATLRRVAAPASEPSNVPLENRPLLDFIATYEMRTGKATPVAELHFEFEQEDERTLVAHLEELERLDLVRISGTSRDLILLTQFGVLSCADSARWSEFGERLLTYLRQRIEAERTQFKEFTWEELRATLHVTDADFSILERLIAIFGLNNGARTSPGPPPSATWTTPPQRLMVKLRTVHTLEQLHEVLHRQQDAPRQEAPPPEASRPTTDITGARWKFVADLGRGGQGVTTRVQHVDTHELGVKKVLKPETLASPEKRAKAIQRFRREIETTKGLKHPFVLRVLDADPDADEPWVVTEFMLFGTLDDHCSVYRGDVWRSLRVARDVAVALAALHDRGLVHRDVKPPNILLRDLDHPVLGDFGIVHDPGATDLTSVDEVVGPRWFMPPEAELGRLDEPPHNFDVYSLGKVIWTLLSGGAPKFRREGFRMMEFDLRRNRACAQPEAVYALLDRMVVEDPIARFQSMGEVIAEIDLVLARMFGARAHDACMVCNSGTYEAKGMFRPGTSGALIGDHEICATCGDLRIYKPELRAHWLKTQGLEKE